MNVNKIFQIFICAQLCVGLPHKIQQVTLKFEAVTLQNLKNLNSFETCCK